VRFCPGAGKACASPVSGWRPGDNFPERVARGKLLWRPILLLLDLGCASDGASAAGCPARLVGPDEVSGALRGMGSGIS
jgi:hypothetical protein